MKTHKFARKPFYVDAVRVSEANMEEVAEWCEGKIVEHETEGKYISVKVHRPLTERQTQAFIGDWVLFAGTGFKVYVPKAFDKSFEKVKTLTKAQADEAGIKVPHEPRQKPQRPVPSKPKKRPANTIGTNVGEVVQEAYRSAETGQFVTEEFADENPTTTVEEHISREATTDAVLEEQLPAAKKSKADLEAEALIAEAKALRDKPGL